MAVEIALTLSLFQGILAFLLVYILGYAVLVKVGVVGNNKFTLSLLSFILALLFFLSATARDYVIKVTPSVIILLTSVFFILLLMGFTGNLKIAQSRGVAVAIFIILLVIFFFAGINIFSNAFNQAASFGTTSGTPASGVRDTLFHPATLGLILLFITAAVVTWFINK